MGAPKHSSRLYSILLFEPEFMYLVRHAADQSNIKRNTALEFVHNLIDAYETLDESRRRFCGDEGPRLICRQSKSIM